MPLNDGTTVFSNVSLDGSPGVFKASRFSSAGTVQAASIWASAFSSGGTRFPARFSATSFKVVNQDVQGSASSFTICTTVTDVLKGDILVPNPFGGAGVSSISSGLVWSSHCTQDGQFEFRYSNVSTLVQNQSAQTFTLAIIRV